MTLRWTAGLAVIVVTPALVAVSLTVGNSLAQEPAYRWSFPQVVNDDARGAEQRSPALGIDALGTVHAVWIDDRDGDPRGAVYYAWRAPGAPHWSPNQRVAGPEGAEARLDPALTVDAAGRVHVLWTEFHDGDPDIYHSLLPSGQRVWSPPRRVNDDLGRAIQWRPSAAADLWGTAHFAWTDERDGGADIYSTRLTVDGWWAPNVRVNQVAHGAQDQVRLSGTPRGDIHAIWVDTRDGPSTIYASRLPPGGDVWWPDAALSTDTGRALQRSPSLAAAGGGEVHAIWVDEGLGTGEALRRATLRPDEPFWGPAQALYRPTLGGLMSVTAMAGADGSLLVLWGETRPGTSRVYSGLVAADGSLLRERVDSSPGLDAGTDPVGVLDADGRATVLWRGLPLRQDHGDIYAATTQMAAPEYGGIRLEGWLQYRHGMATCTGEGYVLVRCDGLPSPMVLPPDGVNLPPFLGSYVQVDGILKDRDGCPRVEARQVRLATTPCPRQTGAVTGVLRAGGRPLGGSTVELAGESVLTGASGRFFLDLLPAGHHPLTATVPCALVSTGNAVLVRPAVLSDAGVGQVVLGDIVSDCAIDLHDLVTVAAQYKGRPPFRPACSDLDGDGGVGLSDLALVAAGYGKRCPTDWRTGEIREISMVAVDHTSLLPAPTFIEGLGLPLSIVPGHAYAPSISLTGGRTHVRLAAAAAIAWRFELAYDPDGLALVDHDPIRPGLQPFDPIPQSGPVWVLENEADPLARRLRFTAALIGQPGGIADETVVATLPTGDFAPGSTLRLVVAEIVRSDGQVVEGGLYLTRRGWARVPLPLPLPVLKVD